LAQNQVEGDVLHQSFSGRQTTMIDLSYRVKMSAELFRFITIHAWTDGRTFRSWVYRGCIAKNALPVRHTVPEIDLPLSLERLALT